MENFATTEEVAELRNQLIESKGQFIALGAAIRALLLAHPDRDAALDTVTAELMRWEASGLHSEVPDRLLKGFDRAKGTILPTDGDLVRVPQI